MRYRDKLIRQNRYVDNKNYLEITYTTIPDSVLVDLIPLLNWDLLRKFLYVEKFSDPKMLEYRMVTFSIPLFYKVRGQYLPIEVVKKIIDTFTSVGNDRGRYWDPSSDILIKFSCLTPNQFDFVQELTKRFDLRIGVRRYRFKIDSYVPGSIFGDGNVKNVVVRVAYETKGLVRWYHVKELFDAVSIAR